MVGAEPADGDAHGEVEGFVVGQIEVKLIHMQEDGPGQEPETGVAVEDVVPRPRDPDGGGDLQG